MLSRFAIVFLPKSKHLLISWLQSSSAVILKLKKIKSLTVSIVSPSIFHEVIHCFPVHLPRSDGTGCHDLSLLHAEF